MPSAHGHAPKAGSSQRRGPDAEAEPGTPALPADRREAIMGVGAQLRARRQAAGITLRQFAREMGVSPSYISQIENGKSQPSVATLYAISSALDVSIDELFGKAGAAGGEEAAAPAPPGAKTTNTEPLSPGGPHTFRAALAELSETPMRHGSPMVEPGQRRSLVLDSGVTWEQLSPTHHETAVDFLFVRYDVGGCSVAGGELTRHSGFEYGYVISGALEVTLGFDTYVVSAGSAISFDSSTPHRLANKGDIPAEAIWFVHGRTTAHDH